MAKKVIDDNDSQIVTRVNTGDHSAFEELFHSLYPSLCYFSSKITQEAEVSRDIVQDIFVNYWNNSNKFENMPALRSFLYVSVKNRSLDYIRKERNRERILSELNVKNYDDTEIEFFEIETEVFDHILQTIDKLPTECRRIFKMSYFEQLDVKTISQELGVSPATVMTQRQRAKKILREKLNHLYSYIGLIFY